MTDQFDAWNPGLDSNIPRNLLPLVTLFRSENGFVDYTEARELSDLTGIKLNDLVAFRPERLVVHILLVRVTADLSVADGPSYEELGLNLRDMVDTIYTKYISPELDTICALYQEEKQNVKRFVSAELAEKIYAPPVEPEEPSEAPSFLFRLFGKQPTPKVSTSNDESTVLTPIEQWKLQAQMEASPLRQACYLALAKTVGIILGHRGAMHIDQELVTRIIANSVCNTYVAERIAKHIEPIWNHAIEQEGYRCLPTQKNPVVMNVKGASASGKSTIRPQQRQLAGKLNIPWEDFALISPDYWRKYLLDYESLGEDYKYGAMLTGTELEIIDKNLDQYMATKQSDKMMSHLLIDRFRFDSFTADIDKSSESKLLSRFGDEVYLFFMVTPPAETVERAWLRGMQTGRYKAVDDLLYHNVEAYTGMPALFLSWVNSKERKVHFEFLDNDVPQGELPKTAAFGWNGTMTILDVHLMLNIDRYRQVDITAKQRDQVLKSDDSDMSSHTEFIQRCSQTVKRLDFADQQTLSIYATFQNGKLIWWDHEYMTNSAHPTVQQAFSKLGYTGVVCSLTPENHMTTIDESIERKFLVGRFGSE